MWKLTLNKRFTPSATSATFRVLNSHTRLTTTAWTAHATRQVTPDRARLEPGAQPGWIRCTVSHATGLGTLGSYETVFADVFSERQGWACPSAAPFNQGADLLATQPSVPQTGPFSLVQGSANLVPGSPVKYHESSASPVHWSVVS